jgi:hypothetical protein
MTTKELAILVNNMRLAQKKAKAYYTDAWKLRAEDLEQQVDEACTEVLSGNQSELNF